MLKVYGPHILSRTRTHTRTRTRTRTRTHLVHVPRHPPADERELYDLRTDPGELRNVYNTTSAAVRSRLEGLLAVLAVCKGDSCTNPWKVGRRGMELNGAKQPQVARQYPQGSLRDKTFSNLAHHITYRPDTFIRNPYKDMKSLSQSWDPTVPLPRPYSACNLLLRYPALPLPPSPGATPRRQRDPLVAGRGQEVQRRVQRHQALHVQAMPGLLRECGAVGGGEAAGWGRGPALHTATQRAGQGRWGQEVRRPAGWSLCVCSPLSWPSVHAGRTLSLGVLPAPHCISCCFPLCTPLCNALEDSLLTCAPSFPFRPQDPENEVSQFRAQLQGRRRAAEVSADADLLASAAAAAAAATDGPKSRVVFEAPVEKFARPIPREVLELDISALFNNADSFHWT